jgi:hypothetical protein
MTPVSIAGDFSSNDRVICSNPYPRESSHSLRDAACCRRAQINRRKQRGLPHHQYSLGSDEINGTIGFSRKCEIPDDRSVGKLTQGMGRSADSEPCGCDPAVLQCGARAEEDQRLRPGRK